MTRSACIAGLGLVMAGFDGSAQVAPQTRDSLAQLYAPRFHFSPSETFFPAIPFGPALDRLNNNADSVNQVDEVGEIAPLDGTTRRIDHRRLMEWYRATIEPDRAALVRQRDSLQDAAAALALQINLHQVELLADSFASLIPRPAFRPLADCKWDSAGLVAYDSTRRGGMVDSAMGAAIRRPHEMARRAATCFRPLMDRLATLTGYFTTLRNNVGAIATGYRRLADGADFLLSEIPTRMVDTAGLYPVASRLAGTVVGGFGEIDTLEARQELALHESNFNASRAFAERLLQELDGRVCTMDRRLAGDSTQVRCKPASREWPELDTPAILDSLSRLRKSAEEDHLQVDEALLAAVDSLGAVAGALAANQGPYPFNAEILLRQQQAEINRLTTDIGRFLRPPPNAAIFYDVTVLDSARVEDLWSTLKLDGQAWRRLQLGRYESRWRERQGSKEFYVVEYYLYYLNDGGLQGHPHDLEKVFVFVPAAAGLADSIRILAGAGHSPSTPNNVLILTYPATLIETEPNFLVEFGGHSNAPDRLPYKTFQRGWDVNWNAGDFIWGTRDLQAVTGTGFLEDYEMGLTLPRHDTLSVTLGLTRSSGNRNQASSSGSYTLVPLDAFFKLSNVFNATGNPNGWSKLEPVHHYWSTQWRVNLDWPRAKRWNGTKFWLEPMTVEGGQRLPARRHLPWMDQQRRLNQLAILKPYLYPPRPRASGLFSTMVVSSEPSKGSMRLGFSLGSSSLFGPGPMIPGMLQPELLGIDGLFNGDPIRAVLGFRYERYYTAIVSWYLGGHWHMLDRPREPDPILATGGLSFMPLLLLTQQHDPTPATVFAGTIRFRLGVQLNMRSRAESPVAPHFEIEFRPPHSTARLRSATRALPTGRQVPGPRY